MIENAKGHKSVVFVLLLRNLNSSSNFLEVFYFKIFKSYFLLKPINSIVDNITSPAVKSAVTLLT